MPSSLSASPEPIVFQFSSDPEDSLVSDDDPSPQLLAPEPAVTVPAKPPTSQRPSPHHRPPNGLWYSVSEETWQKTSTLRKAIIEKVHAIESDELGEDANPPCERCSERGFRCRTFQSDRGFTGKICARCKFAHARCNLSGGDFRARGGPGSSLYHPDLLNGHKGKKGTVKRRHSDADRPSAPDKKMRSQPQPAKLPTTAPPTREGYTASYPPSSTSPPNPPHQPSAPPKPLGSALSSLSAEIADTVGKAIVDQVATRVVEELLPDLQVLYDKLRGVEMRQVQMERDGKAAREQAAEVMQLMKEELRLVREEMGAARTGMRPSRLSNAFPPDLRDGG
ncbi:hypothetical protein P152DRAFT_212473 [Eremomyces bilateralis CBS 781.70]|uniref:Uncharacterized protein n=1 Tax=Eremomyces bilateralis CBS 781.70 TaxID=1392243 RepID=A0A6G1FSH1_9PEZI|nr:uncharacterized protein P152DRAFT_212473 [Eremomyces bilateralis CBS 781.70]KAF1808713.1 hypothetical protein P152DRAFT_212473 [Eremomyces bilateralis CBS 781.70]